MRAECYLLHMTCDHPGCRRHDYEYTGDDRRQAHTIARHAGWKIGKPGEHDYCPEHKHSARRHEGSRHD